MDRKANYPVFLLDALEFAASIGIKRDQFYRYLREGLIPPPVKLGRRSVWPVEVAEAISKEIIAGTFLTKKA